MSPDLPIIPFEQNSDLINKIVDLVKNVHYFYPTGNFNLKNNWPGYKVLKEKVDQKINNECNDSNSVSNRFSTSLTNRLTNYAIVNYNHFHFPNYVTIVRIGDNDYQHINHVYYLQITVSLLCDYYTIFFVDEYRFRSFTAQIPFASMHTIYSYKESLSRYDANITKIIEEEIMRHFPEKRFMYHEPLFKTQIAGCVPFGEEWSPNSNDNSYSLFELLFSYNGRINNLEVIG